MNGSNRRHPCPRRKTLFPAFAGNLGFASGSLGEMLILFVIV